MKPSDPKFSQEFARSILDYDPLTGDLRWKIAPGNGSRPGQKAGSNQGKRKYLFLKVAGKVVLGHRFIWFWMTGYWPVNRVDHEDNVGSNNKWSNLREATDQQNSGNAKRRKDNTSGHKGVSRHTKTGKWHARIMYKKGKSKSLGLFFKVEDAAEAYRKAAIAAFGDFHRLE